MISIEIPVTWGTHLRQVMESIRSQNFADYEIVVADSSNSAEVKDIANEYGAKLFHGQRPILSKRYLCHKNSKGERELFLDETRILASKSLERLSTMKEDMIVIRERELGTGLWAKLANLDKQMAMEHNMTRLTPEFGFILPRFFDRKTLDYSFNALLENIGRETFSKIVHIDHQLIFREAYNYSTSIGVIQDVLIYHFGDNSLRSIIKKYYGYGKSDRIKRNVPYLKSLTIRKRRRIVPTLKDKVILIPLYSARGISYVVGYYVGL